MGNVLIKNKEHCQAIRQKMKAAGLAKLHVLADFDKTLTKAFVNGEEIPSIISILRAEGYLTPDYPARAHALYDKFHPLEIDPHLSAEEKKKAMEEWWRTHFALLQECGLTRRDVEKAALSQRVQLRDGGLELLDFLKVNNIPLVLLSSNGLGEEGIIFFLQRLSRLSSNIHIISNAFIWGEDGRAIGVREPIVHNFNKTEFEVKDYPFFKEVKERKNVILLGDTLGDVDMINGFQYDNLLKIGFLNKKVEEHLPFFQEIYDVVIINDDGMDYVNDLLKEIAAG
jgi:5'-nucleotidase